MEFNSVRLLLNVFFLPMGCALTFALTGVLISVNSLGVENPFFENLPSEHPEKTPELSEETLWNKLKNKIQGCSSPTEEMYVNSWRLASKVKYRMDHLKEQFTKEGKVLEFAILARAGLDASSLVVLKDELNGKEIDMKGINRHLSAFTDPVFPDEKFSLTSEKIKQYVKENFGSDSSRKLTFTHMGFTLPLVYGKSRYDVRDENGRIKRKNILWGVAHRLVPCEKKDAHIYREEIETFFADDPSEWSALVAVPTQSVQKRWKQVLDILFKNSLDDFEDKASGTLNSTNYNLAAMPFQTLDQNSNQWPLEFLAISLSSAKDDEIRNWIRTGVIREQAQKILKQLGYRPTKVYLSGYTQMATFYGVDKAFDRFDLSQQLHSNQQLVELITVLSILEFLERLKVIDLKFNVSL